MWGREVQVCAASHLRRDARETFRKRRGCSGAVTGPRRARRAQGAREGSCLPARRVGRRSDKPRAPGSGAPWSRVLSGSARGCARLHGAPENGREGRGVGRLCRLQLEESPPSPARARHSRKPPLAAESRRKKPGFPLSDSSPVSKKPVEGGRGEAAVAGAGRPAHVRKSRTSRG